MPIPRVYLDEPCPLDGYEALTVRILANPTGAEWADWNAGHLGSTGCAECKKVQPAPRGKKVQPTTTTRHYCAACQAARAAFGRSIAAYYGPRVLDLDVSTPEAALAAFDADDVLPDELLAWLIQLPYAVWTRRRRRLGERLGSSSTAAD